MFFQLNFQSRREPANKLEQLRTARARSFSSPEPAFFCQVVGENFKMSTTKNENEDGLRSMLSAELACTILGLGIVTLSSRVFAVQRERREAVVFNGSFMSTNGMMRIQRDSFDLRIRLHL